MRKIIFATGNEGKMREIREILKGAPYEVVSMKEAGITADIVEDGTSFEENALIKARAVAGLSGEIAMADDSGLSVDFLDGAPGIYSARFLGEDTPYEIKNQYILDKLKGVLPGERTARFVCAIAVVFPDGKSAVRTAAVEGRIADAPAGENGFGYDPIFYVPEFGLTTAQLSMEQKNKISHRAKALLAVRREVLCAGEDD